MAEKLRSLREEWDAIEATEVKATSLLDQVEARKWALAKRLHEEWNPHNEEPRGRGWRSPDGRSQQELADEVGRSRPLVNAWIRVHRRFGSAPVTSTDTRADGITFAAALKMVEGSTPEEVAPEIAQAMEKPELAEKVIAAMPAEVKAAVAKAITPAPLTPQPLVQMPPPRSEAEKAAEKAEGATSGRRASGCNGRAPGPPDRRCRPWRHGSRGRRSGRRR